MYIYIYIERERDISGKLPVDLGKLQPSKARFRIGPSLSFSCLSLLSVLCSSSSSSSSSGMVEALKFQTLSLRIGRPASR